MMKGLMAGDILFISEKENLVIYEKECLADIYNISLNLLEKKKDLLVKL